MLKCSHVIKRGCDSCYRDGKWELRISVHHSLLQMAFVVGLIIIIGASRIWFKFPVLVSFIFIHIFDSNCSKLQKMFN